MKKITYDELINIIDNQNAVFLCGNGFSMNFDNAFCNIYDRLYEAHKTVLKYGEYDVKSANKKFNRVFKENYKNVLDYLRNKDENYLHRVFRDGVLFAESIISNQEFISELKEKNCIQNLTFGGSPLDYVMDICKSGKEGYNKVNIEYWTVLIYFYFLIQKLNSANYEFMKDNEFIFLIRLGFQNKNPVVPDKNYLDQYVLSNGFNTYYKMLFCTAIWADGKATDFSCLEKSDVLNIENIKEFLNKFKYCMTLNYDSILDHLYSQNVLHLHGKFTHNREFVWGQILGLNFSDNRDIFFSDILIGDYFINKIELGLIQSLDKSGISKKIYTHNKIIGAVTKGTDTEVFVIFGMSIDNDQHILRNIMFDLAHNNLDRVKIIYCNFSEDDLGSFKEQYFRCNSFSEEWSGKVGQIQLLHINTQEILENCFY